MKYNYIRQWFEFYNQHLAIMQQPVAQLDDVNLATSCCQISEDVFFSVPWGYRGYAF